MTLVKKKLGSVRRSFYSLHDDALYRRWLNKRHTTGPVLVGETSRRPLISIVVPTYNTDITFFNIMVESVIDQTYENWELILVDDKSPNKDVRDRIEYYAKLDKRIRYLFLATNHHIAGATNEGIRIAKGSFVGLLDHDDVLQKSALAEVVAALDTHKKLEFIYTDEEKITDRHRTQPFLKPDLNIDLMHSINYITHFAVIRKSTLERVGYERPEYNGAQDWELFLRIIRSVPPKNIYHIPKVLYSWRVHELSTSKDMEVKPYVLRAQEIAITDDLNARGLSGYTVVQDRKYPGQWCIDYEIKPGTSILYVNDLRSATKRMNEYKFVAVVNGRITERKRRIAQRLAGAASRPDIGMAVNCFDTTMRNNVRKLLGDNRANFIQRLTHISISKHIYKTAQYDLPEIVDYSVVVFETKKITGQDTQLADCNTLGRNLSEKGLRHLYVPN